MLASIILMYATKLLAQGNPTSRLIMRRITHRQSSSSLAVDPHPQTH